MQSPTAVNYLSAMRRRRAAG